MKKKTSEERDLFGKMRMDESCVLPWRLDDSIYQIRVGLIRVLFWYRWGSVEPN